MASSFTDLGIEKMATGENAGTWGDKTNTNLEIVEKAIAGYVEQAVTSGGTTALSITDGDATESTSVARHAVIKLTGTITGNSIVTVPDSVEKVYIVTNGTSGAYTVQFKTASGTGITFGVSEKTTRLVYSDGTNLVDAGFGGATDMEGRELVLDADGDTSITADTDDQIDIKVGGTDRVRITAAAVSPSSADGMTLGTAALEFSDLFLADSSVIKFGADQDTTLTHTDGTGLTLNSTNKLTFGDTATFINQSSDGVMTIAGEATIDLTASTAVLVSNDLKLDSDSAVLAFGADSEITVTHVADTGLTLKHTATADDKPVSLTLQTGETDIAANDVIGKIDFQAPDEGTGTDAILVAAGIEAVSEGDFSSSSNATKLSFKTGASEAASEKMSLSSGGNLTISGDLTVSGDDITMGTNTAGNLLVADGTNFNSIAAGSLSEISTVANDDVFIAVDTSGGGLKKIARSAIVAGLATSGAITDIVEDTSPQLGGNLDTNSANILIDDAHFIADENGNEQIIFQTTGSAVNQFDVTNAATGNPPSIKATGGDSNIDFNISAKGTGHVTVLGDTNSGAIQFNCESNSHGQIVIAQPHSAAVTNTLTLPAGSSSTLVSLVSTDTLTNKTLTSPVINTGTFGTSILPTSADGTTLGSASKEFSDLFLADAGTIQFGNDQDITLTHDADVGLKLKHAATADDKPIVLTLQTGETDMAANDVMGAIRFQAPDEGTGTDAILIAAAIQAVAEGDFSSSNNATKLEFHTGASEAASSKMTLSSAGLLTIADDLMIKDGGTIGVASTNDALTLSSAGLLTVKDDLVIKSGGTIGGGGDTDLLTLGSAILTVAGEVQMTTLDIGGTNVTSTAAELNKLDGVGTLKEAGKETIWVPSNAMTPTTSNGAARATVETTSGRPDMEVLDFDKDSDEFAQFAIAFPKSWNLGTVTFQCYWSGLAATTGVAISLQGVAMNDNETIDVAYGTAVVVTDDAQSAVEELLVTAESGAVTIAGTPADNDLCYFRVGRDVSDGNDDMAGDMRLHGIKIFFTTDAANDA
jgi:hypothetical protein